MKKRKILLLAILFLVLIFVIVNKIDTKNKEKKKEELFYANISGGVEVKKPEDYKKIWKESMSDIKGMTIWQKYKKGLAINDGSDTDGDGLTDKEEIEKYKSNPLKVSTAGDLYTDTYKVKNNMKVNKKYKYKEKKEYPYNECKEVSLNAKTPTDFNTVVKDYTGKNSLCGKEVLAQYHIYNYSGKVTIDVGDIIEKNNLKVSKLKVYVYNGTEIENYKYKKQGTKITLKNSLNSDSEYDIYIVKKSISTSYKIMVGGVAQINETDTVGDIERHALVIDHVPFDLKSYKAITVYYEDQNDDKKNKKLEEEILNHYKKYIEKEDANVKVIYKKERKEKFDVKYELLQDYLPSFNVTEKKYKDLKIRHDFFAYYLYDEKLAYEQRLKEEQEAIKRAEKAERERKFDVNKDTFVFGNFKSDFGIEGNCAGIAQVIAYVYNNSGYKKNDIYCYLKAKDKAKKYDVIKKTWDLTKNGENKTLLDKGLYDYKDEMFIVSRAKDEDDNYINPNALKEDETEFISMIGSANIDGNMNFNTRYSNIYGYENTKMLDYSLIKEMKKNIDNKKVLIAYLLMNDNTGHAINIYDYTEDENDSNVTWFHVYDPNFPQNDTKGYMLSDKGFKLRVEKKISKTSEEDEEKYTFSYDYRPFDDINKKYGINYSSSSHNDKKFIMVFNDKGQDLNPVVRDKGFENKFSFFRSSTASKKNDYESICHYKDSYFMHSSIKGSDPNAKLKGAGYNASLATTSLCLAMSCFASTYTESEDCKYKDKDINVRQFLNYAGFDNIYGNANLTKKMDTHTIGVAIANKKLYVKEKEFTLIAVAVRGGGYEKEWAGNFVVGNSGQHEGFKKAKVQVLTELNKYIKNYNISGDIKIWITGYSRGAAVSNLVAGALDDNYEKYLSNVKLDRNNLYAYCFETPQGALVKDIKDEKQYYNIYNIVNRNDPVPRVAMSNLGFTRYGINRFLPSNEGDANYNEAKVKDMTEKLEKLLSQSRIIEHSNSWYSINTLEPTYDRKKYVMVKYYKNLTSYEGIGKYVVDDFNMKEFNKINVDVVGEEINRVIKLAVKKKNLKTLEDFVEILSNEKTTNSQIKNLKKKLEKEIKKLKDEIKKLQKEIKKELEDIIQVRTVESFKTQSIYLDDMVNCITEEFIKNRYNYVKVYQNTIKKVFEIVYDDKSMLDNESREEYIDCFKAEILENEAFWLDIVVTIYLSDEDEMLKNCEYIINGYMDNVSTITNVEMVNLTEIVEAINVVVKLIVPLVKNYPNDVLTGYKNVKQLGSAHYSDLCFAWLMSFDDNYSAEPIKFDGSGDYRKITVNCPIDVEVYDSKNNMVAKIKNDKVKKVDGSSIISNINNDKEKVVYLPANEKYTVKLKATDNGRMNISVREYSAVKEDVVKLQNYNDVAVSKGQVYNMLLSSYKANEINTTTSSMVNYELKDSRGNSIKCTEMFKDNHIKNQKYYVEAVSNDTTTGIVQGSGTRYKGSFAKVEAIPMENYHFVGWYVGNKFISNDKQFRFRVDKDVKLVAHFEEGAEDIIGNKEKKETKISKDKENNNKSTEKKKKEKTKSLNRATIVLISMIISIVVVCILWGIKKFKLDKR